MEKQKGKPGRKPGVRSVQEDQRVLNRSIGLPAETWQKLDEAAQKEGTTRSMLMRRITEEWIGKNLEG